jgi:hypothetical protein
VLLCFGNDLSVCFFCALGFSAKEMATHNPHLAATPSKGLAKRHSQDRAGPCKKKRANA